MRKIALLLGVTLLAIQWPLWFGHGGWLRVGELQRQLVARQESNAALRQRNQSLVAEIASLRQGSEAIEERARRELHMIRADETFFQFPTAPAAGQVASSDPHLLGLE